jgi:hypothetical protein
MVLERDFVIVRPLANFYCMKLAKSRLVVYYRPIFLISFLQEVFLRSVILFQSDFCFMGRISASG